MPIFRRRSHPPVADPRPAIAEFWRWWAQARDDVVAALDAGRPDDVADAVSANVAKVGPLGWELATGTEGARHALVVSANGNAVHRALAQRWWLAAPPPDATFEYHPSRRRDPNAAHTVLTLEDVDLPLAELVAGTRLDRRRRRFDLLVHHPLMPLLSGEARLQLAFLGLDAALGEDDVERSVGSVDVAVDPPVDAVAVTSLGALLDTLRATDSWATLQGESAEGAVLGAVRHPFARVDRPLADTHVAVSLGYEAAANGLPAAPDFADRLAGWEAAAISALGGEGDHAVLVGHVSGRGRCTVHLYVDGLEVDPAAVDPVLRQWTDGPARVQVSVDPAWREIGHLLP